ncbi:L-lactate dehydrogenase [Candidatus Desulforudis audaxviator]|uniref:L-lactate dehydrogenase n=1 Tax=Desulforudis audaxviator (strain MP104C) TaxID=477974 RepID=B1I4V7_DESAP|nr:L-lactate dehydrogenase [Candidatus Desulforudis audaxviator]ACA60025.1 L-lactate dehydrogenase [Candidatus Desulforudis audaxviator MP104C]AZK60052.1 L-lactate dehydrogenase [Candidatus Desulforudis audaxviator]
MAVKVVVVGAGAVGATVAYTLLTADLANELVLIDINRDRAEGEAMDIADGTPFTGPVRIYAGDYEDCRDALIVIFAAGANQRPGETRLELAARNVKVVRDVMDRLLRYWNGGVLLMVTNPVDVLTYAALRFSGLPENAVIGSGTVLDSARFRYLLSRHCRVDGRNVHAYVLGEHGDSEVFVWSRAAIAGIHVDDFCDRRGVPRPDRQDLSERVRRAAAEIIARKGATYYGVSLSVRRICEAVVRDQESVLTVSGLVDGYYGVTDTAFSLPTIVGRRGRVKVLDIPLAPEEQQALCYSAGILKQAQRDNGL